MKGAEVKIDNSAYGQMKSCLGAFNLDAMKPVFEEAIRDAERKGKKEEHEKCTVGCPYYSSGHSIDANGYCNMGCC